MLSPKESPMTPSCLEKSNINTSTSSLRESLVTVAAKNSKGASSVAKKSGTGAGGVSKLLHLNFKQTLTGPTASPVLAIKHTKLKIGSKQ